MKLPIRDITVDPTVQLRDELDLDRVKLMEEFVEAGGVLPPITVVGPENLLADGHHRLELAMSSGRLDIDAENVPGGKAEAIVLAVRLNDKATWRQLSSPERNRGVRLLLGMGWTQRKIAEATGVSKTTVANIDQAEKTRKALPSEVAEKLAPTTLVRIAEMVDDEDQVEFATAVATVAHPTNPKKQGLPESKVRAAAHRLRGGGFTPTEAVESLATPHTMPKGLNETATLAYKRLDYFLREPMTVDGRAYDFWQLLELLAVHRGDLLEPTVNTLVDRLAEVETRAGHFASLLRAKVLEEIPA